MKKPMYLQHVNLYVRDAERSKQWYEDLLGLHTYEYRPGWAAFMSADTEQSHEVALMQLGPDAALQQQGQVGLNHMAWRLEIAGRPEGILSSLQRAGPGDRADLRSRHLARNLHARPRRQRRRGVLRDAARRMAGRLQRLHPREDRQWPVSRALGPGRGVHAAAGLRAAASAGGRAVTALAVCRTPTSIPVAGLDPANHAFKPRRARRGCAGQARARECSMYVDVMIGRR